MTKPRETEASLQQMTWGDMGVSGSCAIPKTGLFKQVLGFRSFVVLLFRIQITVFQWLGFRTITCFFGDAQGFMEEKNAETTDICDISGQKGFSLGTGKNSIQRYGKKKVDSHHNWLNLGCETSTTISSGKWRFRYRDPLPAKKDVDKIILVVGQHPGEPKNQLVTGICRVKRGYYCWWKKSGDHQLSLVVYPII